MRTLKGIIFSAIILVGFSSFAADFTETDLRLVAETTIYNVEKMDEIDWKVGDTLNFELIIKPLPIVASAVLQVTQIDKVGITLVETISYKSLKQVIETVLDPNTGKIVSTKINGKPAKLPSAGGGGSKVINEEEAHIKVKAGEFDCIHVVMETGSGDETSQSEMWINPAAIPINGLLKSVAVSGIATVQMELASFVHGK
jgi:hypothetical protein